MKAKPFHPFRIYSPRIYKLLFVFILSLLVSMFIALPAGWAAGAIAPSSVEQYLVELINQARANPLHVAKSIGLDPEKVLLDHPEMEEILLNGLAPLQYNGNIYLAAREKSFEVLKNNLVDDGNSPVDERLRKRGFIPGFAGEAITSVVFSNYIKQKEAADILFEQLFKTGLGQQEFLPEDQMPEDQIRNQALNIFSPDLTQVGVSLAAGVVEITGKSLRAYLLVADLAACAFSSDELVLLELVNQARQNPLAAAQSLGVDTNSITDNLINNSSELADILEQGLLSPFNMNEKLFAAAINHAYDMLENSYYASVSPDGRTVEDRIMDQGINEPAFSGEVLGSLTSGGLIELEPSDIAEIFFEANFKAELKPDKEKRCVLNTNMKESGISFNVVSVDNGDGFYNTRYLLVADFAANAVENNPYLVGVVYEDSNKNGLYNSGEGLEGIQVSVQDTDKNTKNKIDFFTNSAGGFAIALDSGTYQVTAYPVAKNRDPVESYETGSDETIAVAEVVLNADNAGVRFVVMPAEESDEETDDGSGDG